MVYHSANIVRTGTKCASLEPRKLALIWHFHGAHTIKIDMSHDGLNDLVIELGYALKHGINGMQEITSVSTDKLPSLRTLGNGTALQGP